MTAEVLKNIFCSHGLSATSKLGQFLSVTVRRQHVNIISQRCRRMVNMVCVYNTHIWLWLQNVEEGAESREQVIEASEKISELILNIYFLLR